MRTPVERIDGGAVRAWARAAAAALEGVREPIDSLNVFPVADSDTGTNLYLTLAQGADEVAALGPDAGPSGALHALARGALLGARGNSGVIVSQFLLGFAVAADGATSVGGAGSGALDAAWLARALDEAQAAARECVARPVEGTILTAASAAASAAATAAAAGSGLGATALAALTGAREALARTPDVLAVLRAAQVVDAGAAGLVVILEALVGVLTGRPAPGTVPIRARELQAHGPIRPRGSMTSRSATDGPAGPAGDCGDPSGADGEFEVMYLVESAAPGFAPELSSRLQQLGESVAVVGGPAVWHAHVHTGDPAAAVAAGSAGTQRQVAVRLLGLPPGRPSELSAAGTGGVERAELGLVTGTRAPALIRELARAGAVVMILTGVPPTAASVQRAVIDAGAAEVAVLPGSIEARDAAREAASSLATRSSAAAPTGRPAIRVRVFDALDDVSVVAGLAAAVAATSGVEAPAAPDGLHDRAAASLVAAQLTAIGAAVAAVRTAEVEAGDVAVARRVADDLLAGGGEVLTMLRGADAGSALLAALLAHLAEAYPSLEVVVLEGGQASPAIALAVE